MRHIILVLCATLIPTSMAQAAKIPTSSDVGRSAVEQSRLQTDEVERKAEQTLKEQKKKQDRFDAQVRKATGGICFGCEPTAISTSRVPTHRHERGPRSSITH